MMVFHCFVGFWFFFSFGILCWESLSRRKPFEGIYFSCQTLCCPYLVHKFPFHSEIMIQTVLSDVPLPSLTVTAQSFTLEDVNTIPHQILNVSKETALSERKRQSFFPHWYHQSVFAEALPLSWVFHGLSVRRNITSYLSAGVLKSVTSS